MYDVALVSFPFFDIFIMEQMLWHSEWRMLLLPPSFLPSQHLSFFYYTTHIYKQAVLISLPSLKKLWNIILYPSSILILLAFSHLTLQIQTPFSHTPLPKMHRAILFATFLAAVFAQPPAPVTPAPVTPVDPNINPPSGPGQPGCEGIPPVGPLDPTQLGTVLPQLNQTLCACRNWDLGDLVDPNFLPGPYPVPGQQVYIQDEQVGTRRRGIVVGM